ncbi:MAG TPA: cell division protein FtsQ/DivIB [Xanthobacteraceae bacterium]|jgi:cell division protein FtsQ|nr:cell division protein FtsQ/DivIB [Xanthobacteraceae bacterium]
MDGGGRLDQPLRRSGPAAEGQFDALGGEPGALRRYADHISHRFGRFGAKLAHLPSGTGVVSSVLLIAATIGYGVVLGQHVSDVVDWFKAARDTAANAAGFRIAAIALSGEKEVSREEVLTTAGVTGRASLLFLDAEAARAHLKENPWIADAALFKLYPDRLQIAITERHAFALWQKDGHISVIASDGTVLEPFVENRYLGLPLVVGRGAERQAKDFLTILDRYPDIRAVLRASVLVADRRWNLRLSNGIDVRLPETGVEAALDRLMQLDRDKKILSRDITMVDLRLPDRVSVRLSDAAAQARDEALKANSKKKKGSDA